MSASNSAPLKLGVLLCSGGVQLLDLAAVDLLAMLQPSYLRTCGLPENIISLGREIEFHYIADVVKGDDVVPTEAVTTATANVRITDTLDSVDKLDILFIPGPAPSYVPSGATIAFIQKHAFDPTTLAVLIVCSGIIPAAFSGILRDKTATAPLGLLPTLRERLPDVKWVAKRWVVDEQKKIWTSGGVTNGEDMVAAFLKDSKDLVAPDLAKLICVLADVGDRGQDYPEWQLNLKLF